MILNRLIISALFIFILGGQTLMAQDSTMQNKYNKINQKLDRISILIKSYKEENQKEITRGIHLSDSIIELNKADYNKVMKQLLINLNSGKESIEKVKQTFEQGHNEQMKINTLHTIIFIIIVILALTIVINLRMRKNTINYLVAESKKIAVYQDNIVEKADDLKKLSIEIGETIDKQRRSLKKQNKSLYATHITILEKLTSSKKKKKKK